MRSDPLDIPTALTIGRGTLRKMRQNLAWAVGYNSVAIPFAAGIFEPLGIVLRPEIAALSMSGSSVLGRSTPCSCGGCTFRMPGMGAPWEQGQSPANCRPSRLCSKLRTAGSLPT